MKEMICVLCPMGCLLEVQNDDREIIVRGNGCPRGIAYAKQEYVKPMRMLTTTVNILGALYPKLPVVSTKPLPLDRIGEVMKELKGIRLQAPIEEGERVLTDVLGLGVDMVASRSLDRI